MSIPEQNLAEVVTEFGEPLLGALPEPVDQFEYESAARLTVAVWNAVIHDRQQQTRQHEDGLLVAMQEMPSEFTTIVERLLKRKRRKFGVDERVIQSFEVTERDGDFVLSVQQ